MEAYLDNAATTKMRKASLAAMQEALEDLYGNPSSIHGIGRKAEDALEAARKSVAESIGAKSEEIVFTSGATEGNNYIIRSYIKEGAHFVTTAIEHPSVLQTMAYAEKMGVRVDYLSVNRFGQISLEELREKVQKNTSLVSIMMVNNEMGVFHDPRILSRIIREKSSRAKFHVDAVQGFMKYSVDIREMDVDYMTISSHKVHGPKGVGAVYVRKGQKPASLLLGGEQERGYRAGTVNVPAVVGFSAALKTPEEIRRDYKQVEKLKEAMVAELSTIPGLLVNSPETVSSPYILSVSIPGMRGEVFLHYLSEQGVYVSTGSACTAKDTKDSHVLLSMGLAKKEIQGSIRLSFEEETSLEEVRYAAEKMRDAVKFLRRP